MERATSKYILWRIIRLVVSYFVILTVVFILPRIAPGDPIENALGMDYVSATEYEIEYWKTKYGLDRSIWEQYVIFLKSVFTLDFGYSFSKEMPVADLIYMGMGQSVTLVLPSLLIGSFLALFMGIHAGVRKGRVWESSLTSVTVFIHAIPTFVVGIMMLKVFAFELGWFPLGHASNIDGSLLDTVYSMTLPVITMSIIIFSGYYLIMRSAVLQVSDEHFIKVLGEHGFSQDEINSNHILRSVATQFLSMFAVSLGGMISGAMIIEVVFSLNGMGSILYDAISYGDYPVIQGSFIFITASVLIANLLAEVLYGVLDPRVPEAM